jgi:large repetitive protein
LTWTCDLGLGQTVAITYSVQVDSPDLGDKHILNSVASDELGSTCPSGSTDPACTTFATVRIPALAISLTADATGTTPGSAVGYTLTISNPGPDRVRGCERHCLPGGSAG